MLPIQDEDDDDGDFLKLKNEPRNIEAIKPELKVSIRQMKKIKMEGQFGGKNKTKYDEETGKDG